MSSADIAKTKRILDSLPRPALVLDAGRPLHANPAALKLLGLRDLAEFLAVKSIVDFVVPELQSHFHKLQDAVRRGEVAPDRLDVEIMDRQGNRRSLQIFRSSILWDEVSATLMCLFDETDTKRAQEELRQSQALLHAVFDNIPLGIVVKDLEGKHLIVNRATAGYHQTQPERIVGTLAHEVSPLEKITDLERATILATDAQARTGQTVEFEMDRVLPAGKRRFRVIKVPLFDAQGRVSLLMSLAEDITERTQAEEARRRSEALLKAVFDTAPVWMWVKDLDGRYAMVNQRMADDAGLSARSLGRVTAADVPAIAPFAQGISETDARVFLDGIRVDVAGADMRFVDGSPRVQNVTKLPLRDERGAVTGLVGVAVDITELKRVEAGLRANEERYRALVEGSLQGIAVFSLRDGKAVFVNDAMLRLTGDTRREDYVGAMRFYDRIQEPYARTLKAQVQKLASGELGRIQDELPAVRADGAVYWCEYFVHRLMWEGEPSVQFIVLDITARKRAEEALKDRQAVLARQNEFFRQNLSRRRESAHDGIVAESPVMRRVLQEAELVAKSRVPILIEGETGVGKEVVAEFVHAHSDRAAQLLSVVNCGALTDNLMDAELFGYERGAFTGAIEARAGLIEIADKGTLFLDEIGDLPPGGQVRLLRFLERGVVRRVGSTREKKVDVRILAATHKTLKQQVEAGTFREDLYHRLLVIRIEVPPLRLRLEDILPLANLLLTEARRGAHAPPKPFSSEARLALMSYSWPGNVRELSHAVQRAMFAAQLEGSSEILPHHLDLPSSESNGNGGVALKDFLHHAETRHVRDVLRRFEGNRRKAAEALGISERHLYRLLA